MNRFTRTVFATICGLLFTAFLAGPVTAADTAGSVTITYPTGTFEITGTVGGHEIAMEDFGRLLVPGCPDIPARIISIAIPPGATVTGVICEAKGSEVLDGEYRLRSVPLPRVIGEENPDVYAREKRAMDEKYDSIFGSDEPYPGSAGEFVRPAAYRKYNLADVRIYPFSYRPQSGKLIHHPEMEVTVHYRLPEIMPAGVVVADNLPRPERRAREIVYNYGEASSWYAEAGPPVDRGLYDYVIITLESLVSSVQPLVDWEVSKGRTVNVVTTTWINDNYTGYDLAEKMRNFLRDKYPSGEWGIEDVCLVGHYDDVPMRRCAQDVGYGSPEPDYYYAELSLPDNESWDADGDHQWGENSDPIDFTAEVNVGRIPWSNPATVESICSKSVAFENNGDPAFKKNILLLGAFFWEDTDNAVLMEYKTDSSLHSWMADWTMTRMYEEGYSSYPCDQNLTNSNAVSEWSSGMYSFVDWAGHGSPTSAHIMYNGSPAFITSSDCSALNDDYPSIVFADACSNSDTDYLNIGQEMMRQGAIGFLGATKVAYGMPAWNDPMDGSTQSLDYYFTTCCTSGDYTQGQGHQWSLYQMYTYGLFGYTKYETFEWGALWGNPDLSMGTMPTLSFVFPDGLPGDRLPPGPETVISLEIRDGQEVYEPGTGKLHYRFDPADPYTEIDFDPMGGDLYQAVIPATSPGSQPEYYFSAQGDGGTTVYSPFNAPGSTYSFDVCLVDQLLHDDFESDIGWTVEDFDVQTGTWERCVPNTTTGEQVAPAEDNPAGTGSYCFVTANGPPGSYYADYDIDGGPTILTSPAIDLSDGDAEISFYAWFYGRDGDDPFTLEISDDDGANWTNVFTTYTNLGGWTQFGFPVSDFVSPTEQVRIRFSAQDNPNNSITEAGLDDFKVERLDFEPSFWAQAYDFSAASGCNIDLYIDAGVGNAGRPYLVGGSFSGAHPGTTLPGGNTIPLNRDLLTDFILDHLNGLLFQNFSGTLDGDGRAIATVNIPGPVNPAHVGKTVTFAFTLTDGFDFVSNPMFIEIDP